MKRSFLKKEFPETGAHHFRPDVVALASLGDPEWKAGDLSMAVLATQRTDSYLQNTLKSLSHSASGSALMNSATVFFGAPLCNSANSTAAKYDLPIKTIDGPEWKSIAHLSVHRRFCANYCRCLKSMGTARGLVIVEDDVSFAPGFLEELLSALNEMRRHEIREFALSAYCGYADPSEAVSASATHFSRYRKGKFFGTQFMVYTAGLATLLAGHLWTRGVLRGELPGDLIIRDVGDDRESLYLTRHSLVQHEGYVSTGLGRFHAAPNFLGKSN